MITLLSIFFGGVISALVTLFLGQPLQHYFWKRQRLAERQLAVIDDANGLASEVQFLLLSGEDIAPRAEKLSILLGKAAANVHTLFSKEGYEAFEVLNKAIGIATLQVSPERTTEQRSRLSELLIQAQKHALTAPYQEMGIPTHPLKQLVKECVVQPFWRVAWYQPRQYWRETCRPALRRLGERRCRRRV